MEREDRMGFLGKGQKIGTRASDDTICSNLFFSLKVSFGIFETMTKFSFHRTLDPIDE